MTDQRIRDAVTMLLAQRDPLATICPSEAARAVAPGAWRPLMPRVREVARAMAREGLVEVRQAGQAVGPDASLRGPIRLARNKPP